MVMRALKGWSFLTTASLVLLLYWGLQLSWTQQVIGLVYPIVTQLEITGVESVIVNEVNSSLIEGHAFKLHNCTFKGIDWSLGGPDGVPVKAEFIDPPKVYSTGEIFWEGLLVGIPPDRLTETYGEVIHDCGITYVRTPFYAGTILHE